MFFKSFYTRIIFILASMSLFLFIVLALINSIVFRNKSLDTLAELQKPRVMRLFRLLDQRFDQQYELKSVKSTVDSLFVEFNIDIYDKNKNRITGTTSDLTNLVSTQKSEHLNQRQGFTVFSKFYYNPNQESPFHAIKIEMSLRKTPVLHSVFFYFILSGVLSIVVSTVVGYRLVFYLNQRLKRLNQGVSKVASGDFNFKIEEKGSDEIAFLARKFNYMSQQIKRLIDQLKEVNAARQRLIAHASHEIKSPLTSVKGFIDIIEFSNVLNDEQQKTLLPVVKKDIKRVIKITHDMLQLAHIRAPEYQLNIKKIDIKKFIIEEHSYFSHQASANKVTAIFESQLEGELQVETDPERLSQILDNLWSNSLKYGDHNYPIRTQAFEKEEKVNIRISNRLDSQLDVGADELFEPFYRNPSVSDKVSGSGLGLSIVKELVEKLKGQVKAERSNRQMTIILKFPITQT